MTPALAEISIYRPTYTLRNDLPEFTRYNNTESASGDYPVTDSCERSATIMNDDYVKLSFKLLNQTVFEAFSFIYYDNQLFFLKEEYRPTAKGAYYQYDMKFVSIANMLDKHMCLRYMVVDNVEVSPEPEINMNGTLAEMAVIVLSSIQGAARRLDTNQPNLFYTYVLNRLTIADDLQQNTTLQTFSFSGQNIADVLTQIAEVYEIEWWVTQENLTTVKLHLCKCEQGDALVLSDRYRETGDTLQPYVSRGLRSCEYSQEWSNIPQKIIPFGSDRNITRKQALQTVNGNDMYVSYGKQLRLAPYTTYNVTDRGGNQAQKTTDALGAFTNTAVRSGIETIEMFDDIYPRCHFRVLGVSMRGTDNPRYTITAAAIKADGVSLMSYAEMVAAELLPLQIEPNETLSIIFESGYLNGREFEVAYDIKEVNGVVQWTLTIVPDEDGDNGVSLPFGNFIPRARVEGGYEGDMFAIFHMVMPQGYITRAQEELAQAAYEKLLAIEDTRPEIKCKTEPLFFANQTLYLGKRVAVHSEIFGDIIETAGGEIAPDSPSLFVSRVTSFSHSLTKPNEVEFKLASSRVEGRLAEIEAVIADQTSDIRGLEQRAINLSRRGWHDAAEMRDMLESLAAEMMLVGVEKHQFAFTSAIECVNGYMVAGVNHFDHLHISAGYIQHTQEPYIKYANGGRWDINETNLTTDASNRSIVYDPQDETNSLHLTPFYLYAICRSNATTAELVLTADKHENDTDYLLMGILSSEFEDEAAVGGTTSFRVFNRSNGFTAIAGGTITTEQIQDPTRSLIIDFASDPPRIVAKNGAKIIGNIEFTLTEENIQQVLGRLGDIGGENLIETMGEVYTRTGTYVGLNQAVIPFRNRVNGSYPTFEAGKYVFSAESINILKTSNGVPPNGIAIEIVNGESRSAITAYWAVQQSNPTTAVELETARPLFLRITWSENAEATITIKNAMFQKGDMATAYIPYIDHLTNALKGSTEVAGGLLMTNVLMLKDENGDVVAGMSGLTDNSEISGRESEGVAMFSGGSYHEALLQAQAAARGTLEQLAKLLPILFTKTGSGSRVGCFNVEDENTVFVENEEKTEKITFDTQLGITISKKINGVYVDKVRMHAGEIQNNTIITAQIGSGTIQYQAVAFNSLPALAFPPNYNSSFVLSSSFSTYRMTGSITSINVYIYTPTYQTSDYQQPFSFQIRNVTFGLLHIASGRKFVLARHDGLNNPYATFASYYLALQPTSSTFSMVLPSGEYKMYVDIGSATGYTKQNYEGNSYNLKSVLSYPLIGYCPFDGTLYFSSQNNETITEIASNGICVRSPYGAMQFLNSSANGLFAVLSGLPNENGATQVGQLYRDSSGVIKVKMQV